MIHPHPSLDECMCCEMQSLKVTDKPRYYEAHCLSCGYFYDEEVRGEVR